MYEELQSLQPFEVPPAPYTRQNGIEIGRSTSKAAFDLHTVWSSGYGSTCTEGGDHVSGEHKMPTYSRDNSVVSEDYLVSPIQAGGVIKTCNYHSDRILGENFDYSSHICQTKEDLPSQRDVFHPIGLIPEISLSTDNIPVLCLNDSLLQLRTPSPLKHQRTAPIARVRYGSIPEEIKSEKKISSARSQSDPVITEKKAKMLSPKNLRSLSNGTEIDMGKLTFPDREDSLGYWSISERESHKKTNSAVYFSSTSKSDYDIPDLQQRKARMHLNLHPSYHIVSRPHKVQREGYPESYRHRRSRSLSDLTPIMETYETPAPLLGHAHKEEPTIAVNRDGYGSVEEGDKSNDSNWQSYGLPYEIITTVSHDGVVIKTTVC